MLLCAFVDVILYDYFCFPLLIEMTHQPNKRNVLERLSYI
jgi:hypothetical protein